MKKEEEEEEKTEERRRHGVQMNLSLHRATEMPFVIYQVAAPHRYSNQVPVGQDTQLGIPGGHCGKRNSIRLPRKYKTPIN